MATIGVRELRQQTEEVLRRILEEKERFVITYHGQPVAVMLPLDVEAVKQAILDVETESASQGWDTYAQVAAAVRERWPESASTATVLGEIRR